MSLMCITNQMPEIRSCTIRDQHQIICDGKEYRYVDKRHREETTGRECRGCLPREAKKGLLCWACWERVEQAFADWTAEKAGLMASIDRAVQRDTGGRSSGPEGYVPIPGTVLAVEEIRSYLRSGKGLSADLWVSSEIGAMDAIRFARAVPAALRTHELEEKAHKINRTRCTECRQLTLVWHPPRREGDTVSVKCSNPECGAELPQASFEKVTAIEDPDRAAAASVLTEAGQTVNLRGFFAEDYDPTNPNHEALDPLTALHKTELIALAESLGVERAHVMRKSGLVDAIRAAETNPTREATA